MEYWFYSGNKDKEYINTCLNCQLYSATNVDTNHFTKPKIIYEIESDTVFEGVEAISYLDKNKKWLINPKNIDNEVDLELIKHIIKNKNQLPNIEICPVFMIDFDNQKKYIKTLNNIINSINYGVDYIFVHFIGSSKLDPLSFDNKIIKQIKWLKDFRDQGRYKTKIMINHFIHQTYIILFQSITYDGVVYLNEDILSA